VSTLKQEATVSVHAYKIKTCGIYNLCKRGRLHRGRLKCGHLNGLKKQNLTPVCGLLK